MKLCSHVTLELLKHSPDFHLKVEEGLTWITLSKETSSSLLLLLLMLWVLQNWPKLETWSLLCVCVYTLLNSESSCLRGITELCCRFYTQNTLEQRGVLIIIRLSTTSSSSSFFRFRFFPTTFNNGEKVCGKKESIIRWEVCVYGVSFQCSPKISFNALHGLLYKESFHRERRITFYYVKTHTHTLTGPLHYMRQSV